MFDLRRFARLAAAEWLENRRTWAWFLGIGIIVHFVLVLIILSGKQPWLALGKEAQIAVFVAGLLLTAPIFAGRYFQSMARPGPALLALMRPASALEKWLLAMLVVGVAYPLAYHLAFFVCNVPATLIAAAGAADELASLAPATGEADAYMRARLQPGNFAIFHVFDGALDAKGLVGLGLGVTTLQAFAVAGSLVFRQWPFLKTLLAGFLVLLASILLSVVSGSAPEQFLGYWSADRELEGAGATLYPIVWFAVPVLLWLAAYVALHEREVGR